MIDREHDLPVTRQAELVGLPRSTVVLPARAGERRRSGLNAPDR
jgi:hypothetical protein